MLQKTMETALDLIVKNFKEYNRWYNALVCDFYIHGGVFINSKCLSSCEIKLLATLAESNSFCCYYWLKKKKKASTQYF